MFRKEANKRPSEEERKKTLKSQNRHVGKRERAEAEWTLFEEVLKAQ